MDRKRQPHHPFVGSDFTLRCWQQSLTLNVTAHFIAMMESLCPEVSLLLGVSGQSLGEVFCSFTPVCPTSAPISTLPFTPRPWVFLALIPSSLYHSSPGAQSTLLSSPGRWPRQCA